MAMRTIKHDDHEHAVKVVNEEVLGIKVDDREKEKISEAFGWPDEKFDMFYQTLKNYKRFVEAAEELNHDLPMSTKNSMFVDFLKSDAFRKLGIKIETPNDYFMLGFLYHAVMQTGGMPQFGGIMSGGELADLLEHFKKNRK